MLKPVFTRAHGHKIDKKGRVSVPSQYRTIMAGKEFFPILNTLTTKPYLEIHSFTSLEKLSDDYLRSIACEVGDQIQIDSMGRLIIPKNIRHELELDNEKKSSEVIFFGLWDSFGICAKNNWNDIEETLKDKKGFPPLKIFQSPK